MPSTSTVTRKIGKDVIPAVGLGLMGISAAYGPTESDEERFKVLDRAHEIGCRHWDTANLYADSEALIGKWFKRTGKRSDIFLASKFGATFDGGVNGQPSYVKECAEKALKTLQVDQIDLYYLHRVDSKVPIEQTVGAMAELVKEGKVKYLGISECSSAALRRAHAVHPIAAVEVEYSPFTLDIEDPKIALLATARELGVKIVAYSPLGRGFLTGQIKSYEDLDQNDFRRTVPFYKENFPKILALADEIKAIGAKHGATAGQVCIAWLLAQGDDIIPIPGTKKIKYIDENFAAGNIKLAPEEVEAVRTALKKAGMDNTAARYGPGLVEQIFVDSPPLKQAPCTGNPLLRPLQKVYSSIRSRIFA